MKKLHNRIQLHLSLLLLRLHARNSKIFGAAASAARTEFVNIGEGTHEHGVKTYLPDSGTTSRYLLYKIGSTPNNCVVTGAGDTPLGPSDDVADANNLDIPIGLKLLGAVKGTVRMITDGTLTNGARVTTGASGQVTAATTGQVSFGIAIIGTDQTSAAGDAIEVIPCIPQKYTF